ncbi:sarcosine oxidase subunit gamma [Phaeovulum sp. W22_SRMD_FR3]|uniref:sarcosine oxidase subunit gamma n=1 Tax=Phaeovulum sp. W22_SRMD_FR3 TaxID=3240274 RepID=UPI003F98FF53
MTDLMAITALGAASARRQTFGALTLRENPDIALASLALRRGAEVPRPMGLTLPQPGGLAAGQGIGAFWTGPDQWMIEAEGRAGEDFAAALKEVVPQASVTEQTDGFVVFEITSSAGGAPIQALLEKLVNLDPARFGPASATRTGLDHMSVFVLRRSEDHCAFLGMRSFAGSLWHALSTAAGRLQQKA